MGRYKDRYPQWFKMRVVESGAHTYTAQAFETPVVAGPSSYYIMNVIGVYYEFLLGDGAQLVTAKETGGHIQITHDEQTASLLGDHEDLIHYFSYKAQVLTEGGVDSHSIFIPCHDGNGNGILIADKEIWMAIAGDSDMATATIGNAWLLYTMVKVSAQELLDMLQED